MKKNKSTSEKLQGIFILIIAAIFITEFLFLKNSYDSKIDERNKRAVAAGNAIANEITVVLARCEQIIELIENQYRVYGDVFLDNFHETCAGFVDESLAIDSCTFDANGIIEYAYPKEISRFVLGFETLKDPVQGPKARLAIESHQTTIAGPHNLLEGGKGLIIRNPYYDKNGDFEGFANVVLPVEQLLKHVNNALSESQRQYKFAVSKSEDPTAVYEEGGWILKNTTEPVSRDVMITFEAPNDTWQLAVEPMGDYSPIIDMKPEIIMAMVTMSIVLMAFYILSRSLKLEEESKKRIEDAAKASEQASLAKTAFLFRMSHDIRTPMNAIMGFSDLIEKYQDDEKRRKDYLDKIKKSGSILLSIINNVLELSRIETGSAYVVEKPYNVYQFNDTLFAVFENMMKEKDISFSKIIEIEHPIVYCDEGKLREIFLNILSNAYKYTEPGGSIKMHLTEHAAEDPGFVIFRMEIKDTGIGMSKEFLPHIFDEFEREHTAFEKSVEGTGLGMSIVKKLVEMMDGTIDVDSTLGAGTIFTVTFKHRIADEASVALNAGMDEKKASFAGKRILLAEDNELNSEIACELLEEEGFITEWARDGKKCVEMLSSHPAGYYDVIMMDIQMPNMNGYEATVLIRNMEDRDKAVIPIIAMTANAFDEDRQDALNAGMNDHLAKPIAIEELLMTLARVLNMRTPA